MPPKPPNNEKPEEKVDAMHDDSPLVVALHRTFPICILFAFGHYVIARLRKTPKISMIRVPTVGSERTLLAADDFGGSTILDIMRTRDHLTTSNSIEHAEGLMTKRGVETSFWSTLITTINWDVDELEVEWRTESRKKFVTIIKHASVCFGGKVIDDEWSLMKELATHVFGHACPHCRRNTMRTAISGVQLQEFSAELKTAQYRYISVSAQELLVRKIDRRTMKVFWEFESSPSLEKVKKAMDEQKKKMKEEKEEKKKEQKEKQKEEKEEKKKEKEEKKKEAKEKEKEEKRKEKEEQKKEKEAQKQEEKEKKKEKKDQEKKADKTKKEKKEEDKDS